MKTDQDTAHFKALCEIAEENERIFLQGNQKQRRREMFEKVAVALISYDDFDMKLLETHTASLTERIIKAADEFAEKKS